MNVKHSEPVVPKINQEVDAVYVLSVRSFSDRIAHMQREMARHGIAFEFIFAHDAHAIPAETLDRVFAPSDLRRAQQSLVLKHIETWRLCIARDHQRVLVFEDDAVLEARFAQALQAALTEADRIDGAWMIYLGRGDNRHVGAGPGSTALIPGGVLPASEAVIFNRAAAQRRLQWVEQYRIVRPADWLMREMDAAIGVMHYWLRDPVVEQGSMNGMFNSVLDRKRMLRGRWYSWLRYRWDRWWKRTRRDLSQPAAGPRPPRR